MIHQLRIYEIFEHNKTAFHARFRDHAIRIMRRQGFRFVGTPVTPNLRTARADDADAVADVYLRSRKELVACAPLAHSDADVRAWIRERLIPAGRTTIAVADGRVVGLLTASPGAESSWIDHLYVVPDWIERGVGTRLLELARRQLPPPIRLYTFQDNQRARRFYESRGFRAIAFGDGSGNEEKCPEILYEWELDAEAARPRVGGDAP